MSLNDVLWNKLDLLRFGSLDGIEFFNEPQFVDFYDMYNSLNYGIDIHYRYGINKYCIAHACLKNKKACGVLWNIYMSCHNEINSILGVVTIMSNKDPADLPQAFPYEVVRDYGGERL